MRKRLEVALKGFSDEPVSAGWMDLEMDPSGATSESGGTESGRRSGGNGKVHPSAEAVASASDAVLQSGDPVSDDSVRADRAGSLSAEPEDAVQASRWAAVKAFQAAIKDAQRDAESELILALERLRDEAAERHASEMARITERYEEELRQTRDATRAEIAAAIERVRNEETERYAAEWAKVREELEQQHLDDLHHARSAIAESLKALTGNILQRVGSL